MTTTALALPAGRLPGLHTRPDTWAWVPYRLLWLPAFALALGVCWAAFHGWETRAGRPGGGHGRDGADVNPVTRSVPEQAGGARTLAHRPTGREHPPRRPETTALKGVGHA